MEYSIFKSKCYQNKGEKVEERRQTLVIYSQWMPLSDPLFCCSQRLDLGRPAICYSFSNLKLSLLDRQLQKANSVIDIGQWKGHLGEQRWCACQVCLQRCSLVIRIPDLDIHLVLKALKYLECKHSGTAFRIQYQMETLF